MRRRLLAALPLLLLLLLSNVSGAATPLLSVFRIYGEDDYLCLDFYFKNAVDGEIFQALENGIPAQVTYKIDVWRNRPNWYDKVVKSVTFTYRMHYDNWEKLYQVTWISGDTHERSPVGDKAELVQMVCNQKATRACPLGTLDPESSYYVTVAAEVQALSAERVREIDSWLGGSDETEQAEGGLLGFVVGLFTSKSKSAETKTNLFSLEGLGG
jgi:hypothetical protein